jgi:MFS family permease
MLAFVRGWKLAVVFLFLERVGKAIRKPAGDAVLSFAAKRTGSGFGFGLHEAMDQIGAFLGPTLFSVLLFTGPDSASLAGYREGLLLLLSPRGSRWRSPLSRASSSPARALRAQAQRPGDRDQGLFPDVLDHRALLGAVGHGHNGLPAHRAAPQERGTFSEEAIPLLYAGSMAVDAAAALIFGRLYDRFGLKALAGLFVAELFTAPLVFLGPFGAIIFGMALWGISTGTQESILKAAIGDRVSEERRARAFGLFNTVFGLFWFIGSAVIGVLYDRFGPVPMVVFSVVAQTGALALFLSLFFGKKRAGDAA